jgi:hypothetical protein
MEKGGRTMQTNFIQDFIQTNLEKKNGLGSTIDRLIRAMCNHFCYPNSRKEHVS